MHTKFIRYIPISTESCQNCNNACVSYSYFLPGKYGLLLAWMIQWYHTIMSSVTNKLDTYFSSSLPRPFNPRPSLGTTSMTDGAHVLLIVPLTRADSLLLLKLFRIMFMLIMKIKYYHDACWQFYLRKFNCLFVHGVLYSYTYIRIFKNVIFIVFAILLTYNY